MNMLPCWLSVFLRLLIRMQHSNTSPTSSAAPTTDPTTMPAMAPPDRPPSEFELPAPAELVGLDVAVAVGVENVMVCEMVGRTTPAQRDSAFEL